MTPNTDTTTETRTRTTRTDNTRTDRNEQRYTCTENTGAAAVPDLRRNRDRDERDDMDEQIWSHRL